MPFMERLGSMGVNRVFKFLGKVNTKGPEVKNLNPFVQFRL